MAGDNKSNFDNKDNSLNPVHKKQADLARRRKPEGNIEEKGVSFSWSAVANQKPEIDLPSSGLDNFMSNRIEFGGRNLENGKFANENFENANFSVANLKGVDFSGANLKGADLSGADLTGANLTGADLTGAVLSNAVLKNTNFTGANLTGVVLMDADLDNAILLDVTFDAISLEDLQELIEYLAKYAPHKLNLSKINLTMLNLAQIELKNLDLRGVDFTGCDFTGVNITELDLSECIITPQQIAQALGKVPNAEELRRIMAPKAKSNVKKSSGIDISSLFLDDGREAGVWDVRYDEGISVQKLVDVVKAGHKVYRRVVKRPSGNTKAETMSKAEDRQQAQTSTEDLKKVLEDNKRALIEKHKQEELEARRHKKLELEQALLRENESEKTAEESQKSKTDSRIAERINAFRDRSRD